MLHHFGHYMLEEMEPTHCAQFLKWCREEGRSTTGNREKAFMSSVYEFSLAEGWCRSNPWRGVRRNKERPSRKYIEHWELQAAIDRAPEALQPLLAVAYLTGIRQTDLRLMKRSQIANNALWVTESKTGKKNEHEITPTVGMFLSQALTRTPESEFVFTSAKGLPWSEWGLQSALRRFKPGFRFRDLRSKAQTDSAKDILGHSGQMRERYHKRRKLSAVK
jgi:integrase